MARLLLGALLAECLVTGWDLIHGALGRHLGARYPCWFGGHSKDFLGPLVGKAAASSLLFCSCWFLPVALQSWALRGPSQSGVTTSPWRALLTRETLISLAPWAQCSPWPLLASCVLGFRRVALGAAATCGSWEAGPPETTNPMVLEKLLLQTPILLSRREGQLHLPQFSWPTSHLLESSQPVLGLPHPPSPVLPGSFGDPG